MMPNDVADVAWNWDTGTVRSKYQGSKGWHPSARYAIQWMIDIHYIYIHSIYISLYIIILYKYMLFTE